MICRDCRRPLHQGMEKAIGEPRDRAWAMVWMDADENWVCERTGNEHVATPAPDAPVTRPWIVVEGNPIDGFLFHGIPAFAEHEDATTWAETNCSKEWWVATLQDVD